MVFNAIFNNISVISWRSVLLVEETGVPGENHRPAALQIQLPYDHDHDSPKENGKHNINHLMIYYIYSFV
jgi:hypothetical protein